MIFNHKVMFRAIRLLEYSLPGLLTVWLVVVSVPIKETANSGGGCIQNDRLIFGLKEYFKIVRNVHYNYSDPKMQYHCSLHPLTQ